MIRNRLQTFLSQMADLPIYLRLCESSVTDLNIDAISCLEVTQDVIVNDELETHEGETADKWYSICA